MPPNYWHISEKKQFQSSIQFQGSPKEKKVKFFQNHFEKIIMLQIKYGCLCNSLLALLTLNYT